MKKLILTLAVCFLIIGCEPPADALYKVIYHANDSNTYGNPPTDFNEYKAGETAVVLGNTLGKEGYDFINWNTASDGTGARYEEGDPLKIINATIFLYAQWEETDDDTLVVGVK